MTTTTVIVIAVIALLAVVNTAVFLARDKKDVVANNVNDVNVNNVTDFAGIRGDDILTDPTYHSLPSNIFHDKI